MTAIQEVFETRMDGLSDQHSAHVPANKRFDPDVLKWVARWMNIACRTWGGEPRIVTTGIEQHEYVRELLRTNSGSDGNNQTLLPQQSYTIGYMFSSVLVAAYHLEMIDLATVLVRALARYIMYMNSHQIQIALQFPTTLNPIHDIVDGAYFSQRSRYWPPTEPDEFLWRQRMIKVLVNSEGVNIPVHDNEDDGTILPDANAASSSNMDIPKPRKRRRGPMQDTNISQPGKELDEVLNDLYYDMERHVIILEQTAFCAKE